MMKLSQKQLRALILEVIEGSKVDVIDDPMKAKEAWPEVTYRGIDVIDGVYPAIERVVKPALEEKMLKGQEVYLGYLPDDDLFVIGYDLWPAQGGDWEATSCYAVVEVHVQNGRSANAVLKELDADSDYPLFYTRRKGGGVGGAYFSVKDVFPDVVDLRMD